MNNRGDYGRAQSKKQFLLYKYYYLRHTNLLDMLSGMGGIQDWYIVNSYTRFTIYMKSIYNATKYT
ncbi:hypothetical protein T03_15609 [Trichinella britovi]|uniref:Uncharacterized protein n=1 Tax=Trichinella britovi TaxID=45882 RepID=A0A0V1CU65_TRIBR|nr:hypothetical protein T03_15609 [Trichinella britovi]